MLKANCKKALENIDKHTAAAAKARTKDFPEKLQTAEGGLMFLHDCLIWRNKNSRTGEQYFTPALLQDIVNCTLFGHFDTWSQQQAIMQMLEQTEAEADKYTPDQIDNYYAHLLYKGVLRLAKKYNVDFSGNIQEWQELLDI